MMWARQAGTSSGSALTGCHTRIRARPGSMTSPLASDDRPSARAARRRSGHRATIVHESRWPMLPVTGWRGSAPPRRQRPLAVLDEQVLEPVAFAGDQLLQFGGIAFELGDRSGSTCCGGLAVRASTVRPVQAHLRVVIEGEDRRYVAAGDATLALPVETGVGDGLLGQLRPADAGGGGRLVEGLGDLGEFAAVAGRPLNRTSAAIAAVSARRPSTAKHVLSTFGSGRVSCRASTNGVNHGSPVTAATHSRPRARSALLGPTRYRHPVSPVVRLDGLAGVRQLKQLPHHSTTPGRPASTRRSASARFCRRGPEGMVAAWASTSETISTSVVTARAARPLPGSTVFDMKHARPAPAAAVAGRRPTAIKRPQPQPQAGPFTWAVEARHRPAAPPARTVPRIRPGRPAPAARPRQPRP